MMLIAEKSRSKAVKAEKCCGSFMHSWASIWNEERRREKPNDVQGVEEIGAFLACVLAKLNLLSCFDLSIMTGTSRLFEHSTD